MRKLILLAGIFTVLAYNAHARYYEEYGYYNNASYQNTKNNKKSYQYITSNKEKETREKIQNNYMKLYEKPKYSVGIDLSNTKVKFDHDKKEDINYQNLFDDKYEGISISGGARFSDDIGVEAFYTKSNKTNKSIGYGYNTEASYIALGVDALFYSAFTKESDLIMAMGLGYYDFTAKLKDSTGIYPDEEGHEDSLGLRIGLGWQFNLNEHISVRFMGRFVPMYSNDVIKNMTELSAGLRYIF